MGLVQNKYNASFSKPYRNADGSIKGYLFVAPLGTTLPKNLEELDKTVFKGLGFISEDGLTEANPYSEGDAVVDAGGETVLQADPTFQKTWSGSFMEVSDPDVLKTLWGEDNVTISDGIITVKEGPLSPAEHVVVVEERQNAIPGLPNGRHVRYVMPSVKFLLSDDITHSSSSALLYAWTATAYPVGDTPACTRYIQTAPADAGGGSTRSASTAKSSK